MLDESDVDSPWYMHDETHGPGHIVQASLPSGPSTTSWPVAFGPGCTQCWPISPPLVPRPLGQDARGAAIGLAIASPAHWQSSPLPHTGMA
jgi:hypothetical protein